MIINNRPYRSEADYDHMRRLLVEILARTGPPAYATTGNLDWWRCSEDNLDAVYRTQLWFDSERLVAFAWPSEDQVDIIVHPDFPTLHHMALAWAEADYIGREPEAGRSPLRAFSFSRDEARQAVLTARGYRNTGEASVFYGQTINGFLPMPALPPGYRLRHVRGEEDAEARAAFESDFMTAERHARVRAAPTYRPELDIVVEAPDGALAAFALVWFDATNRLGVFEPVGTAVAFQRRGLGRAVMVEGLRRLAGLEARVACVETGVDEEPARRLYQATGFIELDRNYAWASLSPQ